MLSDERFRNGSRRETKGWKPECDAEAADDETRRKRGAVTRRLSERPFTGDREREPGAFLSEFPTP